MNAAVEARLAEPVHPRYAPFGGANLPVRAIAKYQSHAISMRAQAAYSFYKNPRTRRARVAVKYDTPKVAPARPRNLEMKRGATKSVLLAIALGSASTPSKEERGWRYGRWFFFLRGAPRVYAG